MSSRAPGIRETIEALLTIFSGHGFPPVSSESFRQAKYSKPEAVATFWRLLYCMLHVLQSVQCGSTEDVRKVATTSQNYCSDLKKMAHSVRRCAFEMNYHRPEFYCDIDCISSCELLLFFAWLLKATSFISQLHSYHLAMAECKSPISLPASNSLLQDVEHQTATMEREVQNLALGTSQDLAVENALKKVQWLKGKLRGNCASIENAHKAAIKMSHSLLESTACSSSTTNKKCVRTLQELFLLRYPEQFTLHMKQLEWHITSLQRLQLWEQHETIFWQWMESVLDQQEVAVQTAAKAEAECTLPRMSSIETLTAEVAVWEQKLDQVLTLRSPHLSRVQNIWKRKARRLSSPEEVGLHALCSLPHIHMSLKSAVYPSVPDVSAGSARSVETEISRLISRTQETKTHLDTLRSVVEDALQH